jgi:hypothetical protein
MLDNSNLKIVLTDKENCMSGLGLSHFMKYDGSTKILYLALYIKLDNYNRTIVLAKLDTCNCPIVLTK